MPALAVLGLAVALAPAWAIGLCAQERTTSTGSRGRPMAAAEARFAWDYQSEAPALGVAFRLPVLGARGDLVAGGEAVFRDGLTETQGHLDAVVALGGRRNAIVAGGGPVVLSSVFVEGGERETRWGYGFVAGLRQLPERGESVGLSVELRWMFVDELEPRFLSVGVGLPLFGVPF